MSTFLRQSRINQAKSDLQNGKFMDVIKGLLPAGTSMDKVVGIYNGEDPALRIDAVRLLFAAYFGYAKSSMLPWRVFGRLEKCQIIIKAFYLDPKISEEAKERRKWGDMLRDLYNYAILVALLRKDTDEMNKIFADQVSLKAAKTVQTSAVHMIAAEVFTAVQLVGSYRGGHSPNVFINVEKAFDAAILEKNQDMAAAAIGLYWAKCKVQGSPDAINWVGSKWMTISRINPFYNAQWFEERALNWVVPYANIIAVLCQIPHMYRLFRSLRLGKVETLPLSG